MIAKNPENGIQVEEDAMTRTVVNVDEKREGRLVESMKGVIDLVHDHEKKVEEIDHREEVVGNANLVEGIVIEEEVVRGKNIGDEGEMIQRGGVGMTRQREKVDTNHRVVGEVEADRHLEKLGTIHQAEETIRPDAKVNHLDEKAEMTHLNKKVEKNQHIKKHHHPFEKKMERQFLAKQLLNDPHPPQTKPHRLQIRVSN